MKILNTIENLWSYCLSCPICQDMRNISVSAGPDDLFNLLSFEKRDHFLDLECAILHKKRTNLANNRFKFSINCLDNSIILEENSYLKVFKPYFYVYIQGHCNCRNSYIYGMDMEPNLEYTHMIHMGIEKEGAYLLRYKDKYHIAVDYFENKMIVSKIDIDNDDSVIELDNPINLPIMKMDFADQKKAINKIQMLITFS